MSVDRIPELISLWKYQNKSLRKRDYIAYIKQSQIFLVSEWHSYRVQLNYLFFHWLKLSQWEWKRKPTSKLSQQLRWQFFLPEPSFNLGSVFAYTEPKATQTERLCWVRLSKSCITFMTPLMTFRCDFETIGKYYNTITSIIYNWDLT